MVAPDSFKGSLSAAEAAAAMAAGCRRAFAGGAGVEVDVCPVSDGGEGFVEAMHAAGGGLLHTVEVTGPLGEAVAARWAELPDGTAAIAMSEAAGLTLVPEDRRDPTRTTTFGVGELINAALGAGCRRLIVGLGGSATCDGGMGMAAALGVRFRDAAGRDVTLLPVDGALGAVREIDLTGLDPRLTGVAGVGEVAGVEVTAACDVTNPLTGPRGAAAVYGPQKGATPGQVERLDRGLADLAAVLRGRHGVEIESLPGAGAAGGLGGGLVAFCGAALRPGIGLVLEALRFHERVTGCDLCLTGEGKLDGQTLSGKAVSGVAAAAGDAPGGGPGEGVPVWALVGRAEAGLDAASLGLAGVREIGPGLPPAESMRRAASLLADAAEAVVREHLRHGGA